MGSDANLTLVNVNATRQLQQPARSGSAGRVITG
jgi:hypothetical protein